MSINKYHKHILVLPEDDANRQIANGFLLDSNLNARVIQILPPAGGWTKVMDSFKSTHVSRMYQYHDRMMLLLIDFDQDDKRLDYIKNEIPDDLKDKASVGCVPRTIVVIRNEMVRGTHPTLA